jgi:hypothetical protein
MPSPKPATPERSGVFLGGWELGRPPAPGEVGDGGDDNKNDRQSQEPGPPAVGCDEHIDLRCWGRPVMGAASSIQYLPRARRREAVFAPSGKRLAGALHLQRNRPSSRPFAFSYMRALMEPRVTSPAGGDAVGHGGRVVVAPQSRIEVGSEVMARAAVGAAVAV